MPRFLGVGVIGGSHQTVILVIGMKREPRYWKDDLPMVDMQFSYVYPGPYYDIESLSRVAVSLEGEAQPHVDSLLASAELSPPQSCDAVRDVPGDAYRSRGALPARQCGGSLSELGSGESRTSEEFFSSEDVSIRNGVGPRISGVLR